jgi:hypothetical protein
MASVDRTARAKRIACPNFNADEIKALYSLVDLLKKYLKQPWQVVSEGEADLVLVNLDVDGLPAPPLAAPMVGCALRPRIHPPGTIHRPLRAAELLAVLSECASSGPGETESNADERYVLLGWPIDFERWPPSWRRVLAALTRNSATLQEIADSSGLKPVDVGRCLAMLDRQGLVERRQLAGPMISKRGGGRWQGLAAKMSQLLGFAR